MNKEKIKTELIKNIEAKITEKEKELLDAADSFEAFKTRTETDIEKLKIQLGAYKKI